MVSIEIFICTLYIHIYIHIIRDDLIAAFQYPKGAYKKARKGLFIRACRDRTRGNDFKLKEGRFRLDIRKKFFTIRVVRHWNWLLREAVAAPFPGTVEGQVEWDFKQPGLTAGVPAHGRLESLWYLPIQSIP